MLTLFKYLFKFPHIAIQLMIVSFINAILNFASALYVMLIFNKYMNSGVDGTLYTLTAGLILVITLDMALDHVQKRLSSGVVARTEREMGDRVFHVLTGAHAGVLQSQSPGLVQQVMSSVDQVQNGYSPMNLLSAVELPFSLLFIVGIFLISPSIGISASIMLAITGLAIWGGTHVLTSQVTVLSRTQRQQNLVITSATQAMETVRAFNGAPFLRNHWKKESGGVRVCKHKLVWHQTLLASLTQNANNLMTIAVLGYGSSLAMRHNLDMGSLFGANILASRTLMSLAKVVQMGASVAQAKQGMDLIQQFIQSTPLEATQGIGLSQYNGRLEFRDIAFQYRSAAAPLFESINFTLEPGQILMVAGGNGTGKSTFARMMLGLLMPIRGSILADGIDMRQLTPEWWRRQVLYLPQEPLFLNGTLRDNMITLKPDITDNEIRQLLQKVNLGRFLDENPEGLDRQLFDNGRQLSLGIRRRLAIARALTSQCRVVILDEPMEGLDADGLSVVTNLLNEMARLSRTMIICTHSASTISATGRILDLNVKPVPVLRDTPRPVQGK